MPSVSSRPSARVMVAPLAEATGYTGSGFAREV